MRFCTAVNCMDGRVQAPVIRYLQNRFNVEHIDSITEPGPNLFVAKRTDQDVVASILWRFRVSVERHSSVGIALAGHHDCAGNPATDQEQKQHLIAGIKFLRRQYPNIPIIGLWVDEKWEVYEMADSEQGAAPHAKTRRSTASCYASVLPVGAQYAPPNNPLEPRGPRLPVEPSGNRPARLSSPLGSD